MIAKSFLWRDHSLQNRGKREVSAKSSVRGEEREKLNFVSLRLKYAKNTPILVARYNTTLDPEVFLDFFSFREPAKKA